MEENSKRTIFFVQAKIAFLSWIIQVLFVLWVLLLFVIFAKMNPGTERLALDLLSEEQSRTIRNFPVFPAELIAPNPPTR